MADGVNTDTRIAVHKDTRKRLEELKIGAGWTYDELLNVLVDDIELMYGDDLLIAGQEYRRKHRKVGK